MKNIKKTICGLLALTVLSTIGFSSCNNTPSAEIGSSDVGTEKPIEKPQEPIKDSVEDGKSYPLPARMAFTSTSLLAADAETGVTVTVTATVLPEDAADKTVDWSVAWADDATLKTAAIGDYLTVTPESDGALTASVNCKKSFGNDTIILTVKTRDGGFTSTCFVTFVGVPSSLTITTTMTKGTVDGFTTDPYALGTNKTYTITPQLDNSFNSVGSAYGNYTVTLTGVGNVKLGNCTYSKGAFTWDESSITAYPLDSLDKDKMLTVSVANGVITVQTKDLMQNYYESVRVDSTNLIYTNRYSGYVDDRVPPHFKIHIVENLSGLTYDISSIAIVSSVTSVSVDTSLKF